MSKWIKLNLPYSKSISIYDSLALFDKKFPEPDLDDRAKEELGFTSKELKELRSYSFPYPDSKEWNELEGARKKIEALVSKKFDPYSDEWNKEVQQLSNKSKNPHLRANEEWADKEIKWREWWGKQPEIIAWTKKRAGEEEKILAENNKKSFCGLGLNNPGTIMEIKEGKKISQYLIGHVNDLLGICDDCTAFDGCKAIVLRYQVIWKEEKLILKI